MRSGSIIMFKQCTKCKHIWENREDFLVDPDLEIIGYQANFEHIKDGMFLFNHVCETTLALDIVDFDDLYSGPIYDMNLADTGECSDLCHDVNNLDSCSAECKYAYVREIIQTIKNWPKIEHKRSEFA
jgi:hypothetical protein